MNQYLKRKCLKGGQHHNRDIEALCLQQSCRNDRLLCFYCIHKKHQNHQIIYLLEGLDSPIEKLSINSQISHKQQHQKFIQKKIKKINHGWKNLYRIFESYIRKIQKNLEPQIEIIQESFDRNSAKKFAQIITNANTSQQTIDKYVQKIKLIMKYDLSDIDKVKVSTAVVYEDLRQMYRQANEQIGLIMSKIVEQTNIFSALEFNLSSVVKRDRGKLGIDAQNKISISIDKDKTMIDSFENRYESRIINKKVDNRWQNKRKLYQIQKKSNKLRNSNNANVKQEYQSQKQQDQPIGNEELIEKDNLIQLQEQNNQLLLIIEDNISHSIIKQCHSQQKQCQKVNNYKQQNFSKSLFEDQSGSKNNKISNFNNSNASQQNNQQQITTKQKSKINIFRQNQLSQNQGNKTNHKLDNDNVIHEKPKIKQQNHQHQHQETYSNFINFPLSDYNQFQSQQLFSQLSQQSQQQSQIVRYRNFQYSQSQQSFSPATIHLKQIYLSFHTLKQIQHYLNKIPPQLYHSIKCLSISCDTLPLAVNLQIINKIIQFISLKKLTICQSYGLEISHLQKIINNLPQLQHLVLQQNYSITQSLATLIKKKLPKLKKFHYTSDPLQNLLFKQQNSQFISQVDGKTKLSSVYVLTSIPTLQTIVYENISKVTEIKKTLQNMKKISQLGIIFHQKQYKVNSVIQSLSHLSSAKTIVHLELKQCYFRQQPLTQLIKNCNTLKSLILNKCRDVTNSTISALTKHKNSLKQIDFMEQDQITGLDFGHFLQLQILSLKACWQTEEDVLGSNIIKLKKLKCFNLNFNRYWVTQKIFDYISQLQNLQSLSIDNNKVNFKCLQKIKNLSNLSTLACGNTQLSGKDIFSFFECTKSQIKKLSLKREIYNEKSSKKQISNEPFEGDLLTQISRYAPQLTHLNIKGMINVEKRHFQHLDNLKCLSTDIDQLNKQTIDYLSTRNISLYIGYSHYNPQNQQDQNSQLKSQKMIKLQK